MNTNSKPNLTKTKQTKQTINEGEKTEVLLNIELLMISAVREYKDWPFLHEHMAKMENVLFPQQEKLALLVCIHLRYQTMALEHLFKIKHGSPGTCSLSQEKCAQHIWYLNLHAAH